MPKNHLKRIAAPRSWSIKRKAKYWIVRPKSAHKIGNCIPVAVLIRDFLKYSKTLREVKNIVNTKNVLVNGKRVKDIHLGIGLMDVFEIPDLKEKYIILINNLGKIVIEKTKLEFRISKIVSKRKIGQKTQLNLFGGGNFIVDKDSYKTGDSIVADNKKIKEHLKFEQGASCLLTGGSHIGEFGKISKIEKNKVTIKAGEEEFETLKDFVYITGKEALRA